MASSGGMEITICPPRAAVCLRAPLGERRAGGYLSEALTRTAAKDSPGPIRMRQGAEAIVFQASSGLRPEFPWSPFVASMW